MLLSFLLSSSHPIALHYIIFSINITERRRHSHHSPTYYILLTYIIIWHDITNNGTTEACKKNGSFYQSSKIQSCARTHTVTLWAKGRHFCLPFYEYEIPIYQYNTLILMAWPIPKRRRNLLKCTLSSL